MSKFKIAVLASGSGTNFQAIIDAVKEKRLDAEIVCLISDRKAAYALERAKDNGIDSYYFSIKKYADSDEFNHAIVEVLDKYEPDLIVLAGYLKILSHEFIEKYRGKIINIHPSLIPKHCGDGFWGIKVHESVIKSEDEYSGATVHFVDEGTDTGKIIIQRKIKLDKDETAESLQKKILNEIEHKILIEAIDKIIGGKIDEKSID